MKAALRWQIKKTARIGVALGSWASGQVPSIEAARDQQQIRVLTYHRFGTHRQDPFCVEPQDFEKQIHYIAQRGLAVSLADLQRFINGEAVPPAGAVMITIDDGFHSLYKHARPILRDYKIPAVAFVTAGLIQPHSAGAAQSLTSGAPEEYLTWTELEAAADAGIAIGSHAFTHRSLGRITLSEAEDEAALSRQMLESRLGITVDSFAYPFGTLADFNAMTTSVLGRAGYRCAFTSQHGVVRAGMDPLLLPRVKVESGEGLWLFDLLVRGGLDAWSLIDRALWRVQASEHRRSSNPP